MSQPTKLFVIILLGTALYQGAMAAGKELMTASDERRLFAESMNTDSNGNPRTENGEAFFAAGTANQDLIVALESPDQTSCDAYLDFVSHEQTYLQELSAAGFRNVGCVRWEGGMNHTRETRAITRRPAPPVSPAPRSVTRKHAPTASGAVAIA